MDIGFLLKKFVSFFVEPHGFVILFFGLWILFLLIRKKTLAKYSLTVAVGTMFLFSYPPFANYLVSNLENQYTKYNYKKDVKYIHVLGNGHITDTSQPISSQIRSAGIKRVIEGIIIHENISGSKIIFTGYEGNTNITNAQMNASLALALGVDKKDIIINGKPKDTKEEALFAKSIVNENPFVLVTSATHMPRAMIVFKSLGLNPIPAPTDFDKEEIEGYLKFPSPWAFIKSQKAMHEYLGILWNKIRS